MTQFPKMQARFDAALEIIEGASGGVGNAAETEKLVTSLAAAEKTANTASYVATAAQAEAASASEALKKARDRVDALEKEVASGADSAEEQRAAMIKQIDALDKARASSEEELDKTRQYNKHLKKLNTSLRKTNEDNVGDPELINASLETELEQIKAQRDIDLEEVNGILAR
ncbi:MAG: hypothetical protein QNK92_07580, partial [Amylibacter sp.]